MKTKVLEAPAVYADHHVTEVRRLLLEMDGVKEVYASSAFQVVEVTYDENKLNDLEIAVKLDEAGYLGEWTVPVEVGATVQGTEEEKPFFRHTTTYETLKQTVSFAQQVNYQGRPLWQCPGIGRVKMDEVENG
jgi:copper chaperone CopZ